MDASSECLTLIKHFEGCKLAAYRCPAGVLTIGWGHTGKDVKPGMVITQKQADDLLRQDVAAIAVDVRKLLKVRVTQRQFDALVSFAFNVGPDTDGDGIAEGLGDSTLLKLLNAGNVFGAADQFLKWVNGGGKKLPGLVKRRVAERALFMGADVASAIRTGEAAA